MSLDVPETQDRNEKISVTTLCRDKKALPSLWGLSHLIKFILACVAIQNTAELDLMKGLDSQHRCRKPKSAAAV